MEDPYNKLARLLRTQPAVLSELERKMNTLTGQEGVFEDIISQNDIIVDQTLAGLGITRRDDQKTVRTAFAQRLTYLDNHLWEMTGRPDFSKPDEAYAKLFAAVEKVFTPPKGLFIKRERGIEMLEKHSPENILQHFGYANVRDLIDAEGFSSVMASLRFTQSEAWMHKFFEVAYSDLEAGDFEERSVERIVLNSEWLGVAEKFMGKKYHNLSHLKEFGVIFVVPLLVRAPGTMLEMLTLLLHYHHEVPFYASLFRRHMQDNDFPNTLKSLLRGDVSTESMPSNGHVTWRVVQRYLAKKNADDFRLFEPHINPEANHWWSAEGDLNRLSRVLGEDHGKLNLDWWAGLDFVGELFRNEQTGLDEFVSFDLIDQLMSIVRKSESIYSYHQQEALWNKIFIEYMGREKLEQLIEENLISGFIHLQ